MARNARLGRKMELVLDGRRLLAAAGAGAALTAVVFALGLGVGRKRTDPEPPRIERRLDLLDEADRIAPPAPAPTKLVFHEVLTKERPPENLPPVPRVKVAVVTARPAAAQTATPTATPSAAPRTASAAAHVGSLPAQPRGEKEPSPSSKTATVAATASPTPVATASTTSTASSATTTTSTATSTPTATATTTADATTTATTTATSNAPPRGWAIQLAASPDPAEARRVASRHPGAQVTPADVDGKRWYRVRVQGFATRADAQRELDRLGREVRSRGFVTAVR